MDLPDGLLPQAWVIFGYLLFLPVLGLAARYAPWPVLRRTETLNVFLGTCVGLSVLWSLRAGISPGLNFHLLGVTLLTLMFGWPLAVVGSTLVLLIITLNGAGGWDTFALNALLMGVLPASISLGVLRLAERSLPPNFFVYVMVNAFFTGTLTMIATTLLAAGLFVLSGTYSLAQLGYEYLPFLLLMIFPEGLLNGGLMTMLVGLRPQWVATFDDARYISGR